MSVFHRLWALVVASWTVPVWAQEPLPEIPVPDEVPPFIVPGFPSTPAPTPPPPPPPPPPVVGAPRIFVAPFQSYEPALNAEAARLSQVLLLHMQGRYPIVLNIDHVPPWPDYSALIYLLACPQGQYPGCALVCGNRVAADWTVGGTIVRGFQGVNANLSFVENRSGREVIAFGVALHGNNDADLLRAVDTILAKLLAGAFAEVDIRRAEVDPLERAKLEAARNRVLAASLAELERQAGAVRRQQVEVAERERLDKDKLVETYKDREEVKPWEAVGLSEGAYVRYKNSGLLLGEWKRRARGRTGQFIGRLGLGGGVGPFGQVFDGRFAIDDDLLVAELEQYQYVGIAPHADLDLELGLGVAPFLDVTASYTLRNSTFVYLINQERVGAPGVVDEPVRNSYATWQAGGRVTLAPFPVSLGRPLVSVGFAYWQGTTWNQLLGDDAVEELVPMKPMHQVVVQVGVGGEVTANRHLDLFARLVTDGVLGGQTAEVVRQGSASLTMRANPSSFKRGPLGIQLQGGLTVRLGLRRPEEENDRPQMRFEDEELL